MNEHGHIRLSLTGIKVKEHGHIRLSLNGIKVKEHDHIQLSLILLVLAFPPELLQEFCQTVIYQHL